MKYMGSLHAVRDIEISKKFYKDVFGLDVIEDYGENITLEGGLTLQSKFGEFLLGTDESEVTYGGNNGEMYFETDDLDGFSNELKKFDVKYLHGIKEAPWAQRSIKIYDPDGIIIEIGEPMDSAIVRLLRGGMSVENTAEKTMQPLEYVLKLKKDAGIN